jgi:hypothetical protein
MAHRTLIIWGAGRIGRGFVADLFHHEPWRIVFVDIDRALVNALNERKRYAIFRATARGVSREVMEGGFIQLIQNGYGPFVLDGPFAMMMKKHWGLKDFGNFIYDVHHEYNRHRDELEADLDEEQFMALYEQQDTMNEMGDTFLDDYQESVTPAIASYVREREASFTLS